MAYMRGEFYVWSDGDNIHINDVAMPENVFDQLVAMRWARMTDDQKLVAREDAVANHAGNFGCSALCEELGVTSAYDVVNELAKKLEGK